MKRKGDWLQTYTGKQFWPLDPRKKDVCLEDIAHALSLLCRFGGHCREFYSVAQHSVLVAAHCPVGMRAQGLMHDATEAYLVDVPRPIKKHLGGYSDIERGLACVIGKRFGLELADLPAEVHEADNRALRTEQRDLMHSPPAPWSGDYAAYGDRTVPWTSGYACAVFLGQARILGIQ